MTMTHPVGRGVVGDVRCHGSVPAWPVPVGWDAGWQQNARWARWLAWISLAVVLIEGVIGLWQGLAVGSVALTGWALGGGAEALASAMVVWRFSGARTLSQTAERRAQRGVAVSFWLTAPYIAAESIRDLMGGHHAETSVSGFGMTVLALRLASFSNGVSALHGCVSRQMWNPLWKGVPESEVPIGHVTNGVHFRSWVSFEMNQLYDRYLGPKWREEPADAKLWQRVETLPVGELWRTHERRRERLVSYARKRLHAQLVSRGASRSALDEADEVLNPDVLTIGFGRRFASYKRANLLIRDPQRLSRILNDPQRPVQIIYAGKAHPQDNGGKQLIQGIIDLAGKPEFRRKLVFLENYDMAIARYMLQGCDVWLNTPLRPMEASGTSGMKAQANGALNVSTLDGWWDEAWQMRPSEGSDIGWSIGRGEVYNDLVYQDQVEAEALYELLEKQIVPMFYERRSDGLPPKWIACMKSSIATLCPEFNMHRMVMQYADGYYLRAHRRCQSLAANDSAKARRLACWLGKLGAAWPAIRIDPVKNDIREIRLGDQIVVSAGVALDALAAEDVAVQVVMGQVDAEGQFKSSAVIPMQSTGKDDSGIDLFQAVIKPSAGTGLHGYSIRVLPQHPDLISPFLPERIVWANPGDQVISQGRGAGGDA